MSGRPPKSTRQRVSSVCVRLCVDPSGVEGMKQLSESLKETADTEEKVQTSSHLASSPGSFGTRLLHALILLTQTVSSSSLTGASSLGGAREAGVTLGRAADMP